MRERLLLAGLVAAVAIIGVLGWMLLRPGAVDEESGNAIAVVGTASTDADEDDDGAASTTTTTTTTTTGDGSGSSVGGAERCRGEEGAYSLRVPEGWSHRGCTLFSPFRFDGVDASEVRPDIDVAWVTVERYEAALVRVENRFDVVDRLPSEVAGQPAMIFVLTETLDARTGERTVIVVNAPDGVFFASANELVVGIGDGDRLADRYETSIAVLATMMQTVEF
ncbi:MAG: hypothetical protein AAGD35_22630 [Actinomycetota bacterium]